jgi:S1-C subfamily serine protease
MNRLMFVYLSGSEKGKTRIYTQDRVTLGTADSCDLKLVAEEGASLPEGVLAEVYDDDGIYHLVPRPGLNGLRIVVNGESVTALDGEASPPGHQLHDGDTIQFGQGPASAGVLFQVMPENFTTASLAPRHLGDLEIDSQKPVHPLTATLFVKELSASLWAEIPQRAKRTGLAVVGVVAAGLFISMVLGLITLIRNTNKTEQLAGQISSMQEHRDEDQELIKKQAEEIDRLRVLSDQSRRYPQKIAEVYSPSVCLIVGSYTFVERGSGRLLRYETADNTNDIPVDKNGNLQASVDGAGPAVQIDYTGTGFVVEEGVIATNKHVVQPWATDQLARTILRQGGGFQPRLDSLQGFFPPIKSPFDLKVVATSLAFDVAICKFDWTTSFQPQICPMSEEDPISIIGEPIVLLGYPTGVDGLLQRIDENERREAMRGHDMSATNVAAALAARSLIRPLTTTGTVSDALPGRIVHTGQTTEGGSGSPLFDREGRVIAVNSAILASADGSQSFGGSNFAVPIKAVAELLKTYDKDKVKVTP